MVDRSLSTSSSHYQTFEIPVPSTVPTAVTPARLGLTSPGEPLSTTHLLDLAIAASEAKDAIWSEFDTQQTMTELKRRGITAIAVASSATDRPSYVRSPPLGRRLSAASRALLAQQPESQIVVVVTDGLSVRAVTSYGATLIEQIYRLVGSHSIIPAITTVVATNGRVALGDEIGELLGATVVVVLIGERPGLSASDSLGVYVTANPQIGMHDAMRRCISNIRLQGLPVDEAAQRTLALVDSALSKGALDSPMTPAQGARDLERRGEG